MFILYRVRMTGQLVKMRGFVSASTARGLVTARGDIILKISSCSFAPRAL